MTTIQIYGRFNDETSIGKWGYKITYDDGTFKIDRGSCKTSSSDLMELTAISKAIDNFGIYSSFRILVESEKVKQILDRIKNDDKTVFSEKHYYTIRKIHSTIFCKTLIFETEKPKKMIELNKIYNADCLEKMKDIPDGSVDLVLTDIPYNEVNRKSNGLRNLDKEHADIGIFNLEELTTTLCDKTKGSVYMFCGINQVSEIRKTMAECGLSTRLIVWEKTNPSPMNGDNIWLSGIECCVFGKKKGATFNLHCKNSVLRYPCGKHDIHPTQKPIELFRHLLKASTKENDVVLDPFMGSGTTAIACIREKRNFICIEKDPKFYDAAKKRIENELNQPTLF
ncbi:MAG: site-specific DNA-methyltransferase [Bacteroidales bacterium]|nr:site-specific DNA-methyltransferase [Bacteroidales bacterium]